MKELELWSWKKFFGGFFNGTNYAKAIIQMFCMLVILVIVFSVISTIKAKLLKTPQPTQSVGTNQGIIATQNEDKSGNTYSLFNLFSWK
jgi:hypothetical protein